MPLVRRIPKSHVAEREDTRDNNRNGLFSNSHIQSLRQHIRPKQECGEAEMALYSMEPLTTPEKKCYYRNLLTHVELPSDVSKSFLQTFAIRRKLSQYFMKPGEGEELTNKRADRFFEMNCN
eukprot:Pgem_evm1s10927